MTGILGGSAPRVLERIVACFGGERVPYALNWSVGVTDDMDFLVLVDEEELSRLGDRLIHS